MVVSMGIEQSSSPDESDESLLQGCLQGQHRCFRQLYRRHERKVRSTLYQLCGGDSLDDLVQEVFLRAWKGLAKFRQASRFSTWLYRIAINVAFDRRRSLAVGRWCSTSASPEQLIAVAEAAPASAPHEGLMDIHYRDLVQRGLAQLSADRRAAIVLHDLEELPQKEVAEILGVPVGTVKSRLFHARAAMRQFLESQGVEL